MSTASTYRVATPDYAADELAETDLGRATSNSPGRPLRDATIDWIRAQGLASAHTGGFA